VKIGRLIHMHNGGLKHFGKFMQGFLTFVCCFYFSYHVILGFLCVKFCILWLVASFSYFVILFVLVFNILVV